ncbi:MAG: hypothetical protein LBK18_08570 [Prevotellaceae bacterium]|jgi:hypothetical protein|nr:hypothetical protein [Prevotellaceae bacterium]
MKQSKGYAEVRKFCFINIVYFDLGQGKDYVYHGATVLKGLHTQDELHLSEKQRELLLRETPIDLYPEYYILRVNRFDDVAKDNLDEWIYFLKHNEIKEMFTAHGLAKAYTMLAYERLTADEKAEYDYLQNERSHKLSQIASAKAEGRHEAKKDAALAAEREALAHALAELAALKKQ